MNWTTKFDDVEALIRLPCFRQQHPVATYLLYIRDASSLSCSSKDGCIVVTADTTGYFPSKIGTAHTLLLYWILVEMVQVTEEQVRSGIMMIFDCHAYGWANWHSQTENLRMEQMQNAWPSHWSLSVCFPHPQSD